MRQFAQDFRPVPFFRGFNAPPKVRKDLLGPEERAHIVAEMRARTALLPASIWARIFRRLPATIIKIATVEGIKLGHG